MVAQLVKRLTPDFGSGHHLAVHEFEPRVRLCANSVGRAWDPLSPSLCPSSPPPIKINKEIHLKKKRGSAQLVSDTGEKPQHDKPGIWQVISQT